MTTKSLPLIALVMLLPVAVLAFFAVRTLSLENDALNSRRERLTKQRMDAAAAVVLTRLQGHGEELLSRTLAAYDAQGPEALSALARKRTFVYAAVFENGQPLHWATALEHQYHYARTLHDKAQAVATTLKAAFASHDELVPTVAGYALLRCARGTSERVVCVVADSPDITQELRSTLDLVTHSTGLTGVDLVDAKGEAIAQRRTDQPYVRSHPLDGLLQGWQLRSEEPPPESGFQFAAFLYLAASALIVGWLALTWMLHRSSLLKEEAAAASANVIAQLAHELRTPLANLKLHTDLLRRKASDSGSVERYGVVLESEIDRLASLAENAIAVARGAMMTPHLETAIADDCLRSIVERFEPTLSDAHCHVRLSLHAGCASRFDRTSWERCIVNLIDNARKYAPGTEIDMTSQQSAQMLRLDVKDQGPGIPTDQSERIFEPLDRGITTGASGFGLGLAAVRALARQNGGNCWVEPMDGGAHFVLTMQSVHVEQPVVEQKVGEQVRGAASPC